MLTPVLFVTRGGGVPALLRVGSGYTDDGLVYDLLARTRRIAPAGPEGEAVFYAISLATTHFDANVTLWITPYVDNVALPTQRLDLLAASPLGTVTTHEIGLSVAYLDDAMVEIYRAAPRGTWLDVEVKTDHAVSGAAAKQIAVQASVEWEAVRESRVAVGT